MVNVAPSGHIHSAARVNGGCVENTSFGLFVNLSTQILFLVSRNAMSEEATLVDEKHSCFSGIFKNKSVIMGAITHCWLLGDQLFAFLADKDTRDCMAPFLLY
jgi:hypothetical protein